MVGNVVECLGMGDVVGYLGNVVLRLVQKTLRRRTACEQNTHQNQHLHLPTYLLEGALEQLPQARPPD